MKEGWREKKDSKKNGKLPATAGFLPARTTIVKHPSKLGLNNKKR